MEVLRLVITLKSGDRDKNGGQIKGNVNLLPLLINPMMSPGEGVYSIKIGGGAAAAVIGATHHNTP